MDDVPIRDESIRLGQSLKLAGLIDSGADAKAVIADWQVRVNGVVDLPRGRQLHPCDDVSIAGLSARAVTGCVQALVMVPSTPSPLSPPWEQPPNSQDVTSPPP